MKIHMRLLHFLFIGVAFIQCQTPANRTVKVEGELKQWHKVTLSLNGPDLSENDKDNPFLNYRLDAMFSNGEKQVTVPGYYAADGNAANTGATSGNVWKVHFSPGTTGEWKYEVSFKKGKNIAITQDLENAESLPLDGASGTFSIEASDKSGKDFRSKGRLIYIGDHHLRFEGDKTYFLKGGADSPENFLGYAEFDDTYYGGAQAHRRTKSSLEEGLHNYTPHIQDWNEGDPVWMDGKGKGIIGALNYLSSKNMNSVYFLTMNIYGDGDDVWPYTIRNERYRFDCSKLDQWEIVFSHMDKLGLMLHVVLQETENECILDAGYLNVQRKLYLREIVARFSHHLAITWNLGEEHGPTEWSPYGQTVEDTKAMATYLRETDPYDHLIVVHTQSYEPTRTDLIMPYLGFENFNGPSIQVGDPLNTHAQTLKWLQLSEDSLKNWVVCLDEIGPAGKGALPDEVDYEHDTIRKHVLWANLMAGGGGVEWYFGYRYPNNDLNCEDWRSREHLWELTDHALTFFREYLPFWEMESMDDITESTSDYCFGKSGEIYSIYLPDGGTTRIGLPATGEGYSVQWYDPRNGGVLKEGSVKSLRGSGMQSIGMPPAEESKDWVCLVKRAG